MVVIIPVNARYPPLDIHLDEIRWWYFMYKNQIIQRCNRYMRMTICIKSTHGRIVSATKRSGTRLI